MRSFKSLIVFLPLTSRLLVELVNATPPVNDEFTNRIVLSGNSITFTGTLAEATYHVSDDEVDGYPIYANRPLTESVWWEWTPSQSTVATLQLKVMKPGVWPYYGVIDGLAVYANVGPTFPTNPFVYYPFAGFFFDPGIPWPSCSFYATNGVTHYIQILGSSGSAFQINLQATNDPVIYEQPKSQLIQTNGSALLTVVAKGIRPLSYQWFFGGMPIAGATNGMLALDGLGVQNNGGYFVVVSNITGVTTSSLATLAITDSAQSPWLTADSFAVSNLVLSLHGEAGRHFRIESCTELGFWSQENSLPLGPPSPGHTNLTSVIFNSTSSSKIRIPAESGRKFVRASVYEPISPVCNNTLKQIRFSKEKWAWEKSKTGTDSPTDNQLFDGMLMWRRVHACPEGGAYHVEPLYTVPRCTVPGHILEEPR